MTGRACSEGGFTPIENEVATITAQRPAYDVRKGTRPRGTDVVSCVTSAQFGFEPWKGGEGLAVDGSPCSSSAERPVDHHRRSARGGGEGGHEGPHADGETEDGGAVKDGGTGDAQEDVPDAGST